MTGSAVEDWERFDRLLVWLEEEIIADDPRDPVSVVVGTLTGVLERHKPSPHGTCYTCSSWNKSIEMPRTWPCEEIQEIAEMLGIEL